mgnify:CR=1 FL=1
MEDQVNSRWSDPGIVEIVHNPTEEEKKRGIEEMVENAIKNIKDLSDDNKGKDKK